MIKLSRKKEIILVSKHGTQFQRKYSSARHMNQDQYSAGWNRGKVDCLNNLPFGKSCNRMSYSFCKGYIDGWRYSESSGNHKRMIKRFLAYGEEQ